MNFLSIITTFLPLLLEVFQAAPAIQSAWNKAAGNSLQKVQTVLQSSVSQKVIDDLAAAGGQMFPNLQPELHAAAAALIVAHPNAVAYVQDGLNLVAAANVFALPGGHYLGVDGIYGPKTVAAIQAFEQKMGLPATSAITDALNNALGAALAKL